MAVNPLDVIRISAKFVQAGQELRNIFEVIHAGVVSVAESDVYDALSAWLDGAYSIINAGVTDELEYDTIEAVNVTQDISLGEESWPTLTQGAATVSQASPLQVSACVRFPTNFIGSQARKFVPGLQEGQLEDNGILATSTQAGYLLWGADILDGFEVDSQSFVYGVDNEEKARFAAAVSVIVNDVVSTLGRRKQGVGI